MSSPPLSAAAYETGDAACWEAAHVRAEEALGSADAALLVARATAMVRVIRVDRPDFGFLPPPRPRSARRARPAPGRCPSAEPRL